jgi:hypothetical protein
MSWESVRDIGFLMFVCGSFALFAVTLGRYLDPPQPDERIRSIGDSWMWSAGDVLMLAGACLAVLGMFLGYVASI